MKKNLLKEIIQEVILSEIGEASAKPYQFRFDDEDHKISFSKYIYVFDLDDQPEFTGKITLRYYDPNRSFNPNSLVVDFNVFKKPSQDNDKPEYESTNLGLKTAFRVMSTIVQVLKQDLSPRIKRDFDSEAEITSIGFDTIDAKTRDTDISDLGNTQRAKLYDTFIRKNFSVKEKTSIGGTIFYILNKPL
jgi:hypothetical protein